MSRWNALKKTYRMCTRLRAQRGGSRTGYLLDAGASVEETWLVERKTAQLMEGLRG